MAGPNAHGSNRMVADGATCEPAESDWRREFLRIREARCSRARRSRYANGMRRPRARREPARDKTAAPRLHHLLRFPFQARAMVRIQSSLAPDRVQTGRTGSV